MRRPWTQTRRCSSCLTSSRLSSSVRVALMAWLMSYRTLSELVSSGSDEMIAEVWDGANCSGPKTAGGSDGKADVGDGRLLEAEIKVGELDSEAKLEGRPA